MKKATMMVAALLGLQGCSLPYTPQGQYPLVMNSDSYIKDGKTHPRDLLRSNLPPLVEGTPVAHQYARAARRNQLVAFLIDAVSVGTAVGGVVAAGTSKDAMNDVSAQILLNVSVVGLFVGTLLHMKTTELELDAVNAYNDQARR
jgi:hypothetical protein